ncbi:helix-turn-helix transcriptional regulator [Paucibacter sp. R3-3]|uniref:Helix-turn-helix transcriptional regulator n=1 Tax=Roseateles agri TaxID=3098619 RepID=A0ABU5DQC0_9BURK|nr:helix-turn-helix transcriptional regulator [Paucibacter sp. R3-3]MDY0748525.1 helix-turn-helix transcriptional regulator [Paucibacter sp. R3-3]
MATEFGKRLKAARAHAKMTQKTLAAAVGIGQGTLSELESDGHGSAYTTQLAAACKVDATWLSSGEGEMIRYALPPAPVTHIAAQQSTDAATLIRLGQMLASLAPERRAPVGALLNGFALEGGSAMYVDLLLQMMSRGPSAKSAQR